MRAVTLLAILLLPVVAGCISAKDETVDTDRTLLPAPQEGAFTPFTGNGTFAPDGNGTWLNTHPNHPVPYAGPRFRFKGGFSGPGWALYRIPLSKSTSQFGFAYHLNVTGVVDDGKPHFVFANTPHFAAEKDSYLFMGFNELLLGGPEDLQRPVRWFGGGSGPQAVELYFFIATDSPLQFEATFGDTLSPEFRDVSPVAVGSGARILATAEPLVPETPAPVRAGPVTVEATAEARGLQLVALHSPWLETADLLVLPQFRAHDVAFSNGETSFGPSQLIGMPTAFFGVPTSDPGPFRGTFHAAEFTPDTAAYAISVDVDFERLMPNAHSDRIFTGYRVGGYRSFP